MPSQNAYQPVQDWNGVYDVNTFVQEQLTAYNTCWQNDELLDLMRTINESGNYVSYMPSFPYGSNKYIMPQATVNGSIPVPVGSYLISIVAYMDDGSGAPPGFMLRLFDKGTKAGISYPTNIFWNLIASNMQEGIGVGVQDAPPFGESFLKSPFIVTKPGVINWDITNLSNAATGPGPNGASLIQVMLNIAAPINVQTMNSRAISR